MDVTNGMDVVGRLQAAAHCVSEYEHCDRGEKHGKNVESNCGDKHDDEEQNGMNGGRGCVECESTEINDFGRH